MKSKIISREVIKTKNSTTNKLDEFLSGMGSSGLSINQLHPTSDFNDELYTQTYNNINNNNASDDILQFKQNKINDRLSLINDINKFISSDLDEDRIYTKRYVDSIKMVMLAMEETDNYIDQCSEIIDNMKSIRGKGSSMTMNEQAKIRSSLMTNKLQLIKEYNSIKKTICDFELKSTKSTEAESSKENSEFIMGNLLSKILEDGMTTDMQLATKKAQQDELYKITNGASNQKTTVTEMADKYYNKTDDNYQLPTSYNLASLNNDLGTDFSNITSNHHYDNNIYAANSNVGFSDGQVNLFKHEAQGYDIVVVYKNDNDWDYVAIDCDGNVIPNADVPNKEVNKLKFNLDINKATDKVGRTYKVMYAK